jgi:hypothetical protein
MITFCSFIILKPEQKAIFSRKKPNNGNKKRIDRHFKPGNSNKEPSNGKKMLIILKNNLIIGKNSLVIYLPFCKK